jgi:putative ABC transport system substrate-binding protein
MDRRTFIGALPAAMIAAPLAAKEKPSTRVRRIGFVNPGTWSPENYTDLVASLRALGWVEGQNLLIERRNPRIERAEIQRTAEELVRLKVEIIVTFGTLTTQAAKSATTTVPIVIASAGDPVRSGLVASLARPGGNITGFSFAGTELEAKGLALLRELLPGLQRVGVLETPANRTYRGERKDLERACQSLGLQPIIIGVAAADELENAISDLVRRGAQALFVSVHERCVKVQVTDHRL